MYPHAVIDITSNLLSAFSSKSTNESSEVLKMLEQKIKTSNVVIC